MPQDVHAPQPVVVGVPPKKLDGDDQGVLQQVVVDHPVADDDAVVVGARGEQRVSPVVSHRPDGVLVIPQYLNQNSIWISYRGFV